MLVEELFMQQIGRALILTGQERSIPEIQRVLTDREAYLRLENDRRLPFSNRQGLLLHRRWAELPEGALEWIRTIGLVNLYLKQPEFQARTERFWSITEQTCGELGAFCSPAS